MSIVVNNNGKVVLLLNSTYEPLRIIPWQKAITLLFKDKVDVVEESLNEIHSPTLTIILPSVIKLRSYVNIHYHQRVKFCKENVFFRDGFTCQYCGKLYPKEELTLDHIIPVSHGGKKNWLNIVTACKKCNNKKGNRTPEQARMNLISKPKRPNFIPRIHRTYNMGRLPKEWATYFH